LAAKGYRRFIDPTQFNCSPTSPMHHCLSSICMPLLLTDWLLLVLLELYACALNQSCFLVFFVFLVPCAGSMAPSLKLCNNFRVHCFYSNHNSNGIGKYLLPSLSAIHGGLPMELDGRLVMHVFKTCLSKLLS